MAPFALVPQQGVRELYAPPPGRYPAKSRHSRPRERVLPGLETVQLRLIARKFA
jgi:hypothetical protein